MIPLGEKHLRRIVAEWVTHYNQGRPHLSLGPGIPERASVFLPLQGHDRHTIAQGCKVAARAVLGGLHDEYRWVVSLREGRIAQMTAAPVLCGSGWFARIQKRGVGEEFVGSYLYQVHLCRCLESNDYGRLPLRQQCIYKG